MLNVYVIGSIKFKQYHHWASFFQNEPTHIIFFFIKKLPDYMSFSYTRKCLNEYLIIAVRVIRCENITTVFLFFLNLSAVAVSSSVNENVEQ